MGVLRLLHLEIFVHVDAVGSSEIKQVMHAPALPVDVEIRGRLPLCVHPLEGEHFGIGMTEHVLSSR